ncbi:hypothetical protein [Neorhizobium sp. T25_13]|uniref:hypothetical protein n=1 Tax=Neorhizobium sp. T25_13 TaxID=2093830 RepID=UPI00155E5CDC|nr:hypothetical protein [Neorhizobium sp. T25_13]
MDFLGFVAAVLTVVAALFGLIPPILSKSQGGAKSDESVSGFVKALTIIFMICGVMGIYFLFMFGMTALPRYMISNRLPKEAVVIKNFSDTDWNLVLSAEMLAYSSERDVALIEIIDHALSRANYPLALLAASKISYRNPRDEQIARIRRAMMVGSEPSKTER